MFCLRSQIKFKSPINNLKIERVDPEKDLEALEKLENNEFFYCNPIDSKFVTYHCENNEYFKITDNGKLVGSFLFSITKTGKCRLYTIVIDKKYRGLGLGSYILSMLEKKYSELELHVKTDNDKAISFYERNGLTIKKKSAHHWDDNSDSFVMGFYKKNNEAIDKLMPL